MNELGYEYMHIAYIRIVCEDWKAFLGRAN